MFFERHGQLFADMSMSLCGCNLTLCVCGGGGGGVEGVTALRENKKMESDIFVNF